LNKAHRAKVVDMDAVRDDGFTNEIPNFLGRRAWANLPAKAWIG
jgi:hypothetical protein